MQAVILAAGEGTRMRPLTYDRPKPLLQVGGVPLLQHTFEALPDSVDEVIVTVKYKEEMIRAFLGDEYAGRRVRCVQQPSLDGTYGALAAARPFLIHDRFLVLMADDIYARSDIERLVLEDTAMLLYTTDTSADVGSIVVENGFVTGITESGALRGAGIVNTGAYVLTHQIFSVDPVPKAFGSSEFGLPQTMLQAYPRQVRACYAHVWMQMNRPEDIDTATAVLRAR